LLEAPKVQRNCEGAMLARTFKRFASGGSSGHARWTTYTTSPYELKVMQGIMEEFKKGFIRDGPDYVKDIAPAFIFAYGLMWWADTSFHHKQLHDRF